MFWNEKGAKRELMQNFHAFSSSHLVGNYRIRMGQPYMQPQLCYTVADVIMALSGKSMDINKNRCSRLLGTFAKRVRSNHFHV